MGEIGVCFMKQLSHEQKLELNTKFTIARFAMQLTQFSLLIA